MTRQQIYTCNICSKGGHENQYLRASEFYIVKSDEDDLPRSDLHVCSDCVSKYTRSLQSVGIQAETILAHSEILNDTSWMEGFQGVILVVFRYDTPEGAVKPCA